LFDRDVELPQHVNDLFDRKARLYRHFQYCCHVVWARRDRLSSGTDPRTGARVIVYALLVRRDPACAGA